MSDPTVVANTQPLPKARLHAKLMRGWTRIIDKKGKGAFADAIDCSVQALDKQLAGSMPTLETIDRALCVDATVLDDWLKARGFRLCPEDADCDADNFSLLMARVLVMIQEAEHPDGPGGRAIVPQEYLAGEKLMRELHASSGRWIDKCSDLRRPREVAA